MAAEEKKSELLKEEIAAAAAERPETDERKELEASVALEEGHVAQMEKELQTYSENDPVVLNQKSAPFFVCRAANHPFWREQRKPPWRP